MRIIMMGAPGAGKGTQAALISEKLNLPQISTGDIFRLAVERRTKLGLEAQKYMNKGKLVPDVITVKIVEDRLNAGDCGGGFILDGFPRTEAQAGMLSLITPIDVVLNIAVPAADLIERAVGRRICRNCGSTYHIKYKPVKIEGKCDKCGGDLYRRADDNEDTMKVRLETYEKSTRPLIEYYKRQGLYEEVDGRREIGEVTADLLRILEKS